MSEDAARMLDEGPVYPGMALGETIRGEHGNMTDLEVTASVTANRRYVEVQVVEKSVTLTVMLTGPEADDLIAQMIVARKAVTHSS